MASGIRATVEFTTSGLCPILDASDATSKSIESVARSVRPSDTGPTVTEFSVGATYDADQLNTVFSGGGNRRYRFDHGDEVECPCECLGNFGCVVSRYVVDDGTLTIVFYASHYDELQRVITALGDRFPDMNVKRLIRSPTGSTASDRVPVDRARLTDRQLEVLQRAFEMGYFDRPRKANATEIAGTLGIDASTFGEHLAAAQGKICEDIFEESR